MSEEYYVGQILSERPSDEIVLRLKNKGFKVFDCYKKLEDGTRKNFIVIGNLPSEEDNALMINATNTRNSIWEWFSKNDYKHNKYLRGDYTEEEWSVIKAQFRQKTNELHEYYIKVYDEMFKKYTGLDLNSLE